MVAAGIVRDGLWCSPGNCLMSGADRNGCASGAVGPYPNRPTRSDNGAYSIDSIECGVSSTVGLFWSSTWM